jgi:signal transduction histidine kinase
LIFGFGMTFGTYGNWLLSLLLVGTAVEELTPRWRWPVYACILLTVTAPLALRFENLQGSLMMAITFSPAIFFVALFTQLRLNEQIARQKAELLTTQLEEANRQLAAYAIQAEELATTQERNRLAREIHDNLGHALTIINVQIEAARTVMERNPTRAMEALVNAQQLTQQGLARVRASVAALRDSPLGNQPLNEAIGALLKETEATGIVVHYQVSGTPTPARGQLELALFRSAQEALTNVRKHARASRVDLELNYENEDHILLRIRDNGVGASSTRGGYGLLGISERVQLLKGTLHIDTQPGQGFQLEVRVPLSEGNGK